MKILGFRRARVEDARRVFAILNEVASEIPLVLDTPERGQAIRAVVESCCQHGPSWITLDETGRIVGFLLGKMTTSDLVQMEFAGLELVYGGMTTGQRGHGAFANLLAQAKALGLPLRAVVKHGNKSRMGQRLERQQFVRTASLRPNEDTFVWTPPPTC